MDLQVKAIKINKYTKNYWLISCFLLYFYFLHVKLVKFTKAVLFLGSSLQLQANFPLS